MPDRANVGTPEDTLRVMLDRLATEDLYCVDVETSGLDFRKNFICGYVLAFSPDPLDSYYLPVRHAGSANLGGVTGPRNATAWDETITEGERELVEALDHKGALVFGHNLGFDLRFLARTGAFHFKPQCEDTIINAALLDEYQRSYALEDCAKIAGVQAKKSEEIVKYLCERFPEAAKNPKQAMGHFWRLEGDDPMAHEYARGDGTTTWQLRDWQNKQIVEQELEKVHRVESRLIRILARMSFRGIKVDENRLAEVIKLVDDEIAGLMAKLPEGFNPKSPLQMIKYCTEHGQTDWPYTAPSPRFPKGQPSFPESWLITHEPGQRIVEVRKLETLKNSFLIPLRDEHVWRGRVHATFNQLRGDEYGTITGRLSCSMPNLQQIHKRNKKLGKLIRSIFVPDDGLIWASADFRQCMAAGTKVMIPGGTKNIEDIEVGDWVYSYDNSRRLVLRKVLWSGQTGVQPLVRVHWSTNGRTSGSLDVTLDHPIRMTNGEYKTPAEMSMMPHKGRTRGFPHWIPVLALRRAVHKIRDYRVSYLYTTGRDRIKESRFVFEQVNGWSPEEVHHKDEDSLNNCPENLEGLTSLEHRKKHDLFGGSKLTPEQRKERSVRATKALQEKFRGINNHAITNIEPLPGVHPVYDITVEDTHNFIANEICVHNCEPVLLAYYSRSKVLLDGYRSVPQIDGHQAVADATGLDRDSGKRCNQLIITGGGPTAMSRKFGVPLGRARQIFAEFFKKMPEVKKLQQRASATFASRGYVVSLLGRRARLESRDKDYTAINRLLQCGNADIIKSKMVQIDDYLESIDSPVWMLNNIHDDLSFQFDEDHRPHYEQCLRIMEDFGPGQPIELDVPLGVDPGEGPNWAIATYGADK